MLSALSSWAHSDVALNAASTNSLAMESVLQPLHQGGLLRLEATQLRQLRSDWRAGQEPVVSAVEVLLAQANDALINTPPSVVGEDPLAASGDPHDYFSFASYWWPNRETSDGLPWVREDGHRNPLSSGPGSDKAAWNAFVTGVNNLALAYFYTQDKRYAEKAAEYVRVWMLNAATRMNPHLKYAQAIPGQFDGRSFGIIDFSRNHEMLDGLLLIESAHVFSAQEWQGINTWCTGLLTWLLESPLGMEERQAINNHGTFYDAQVLALALFLGADDVAAAAVHRAQQRLAAHVDAAGRQPLELARTKPFSYSVFNLLAYANIAAMSPRVGVDLWQYPTTGNSALLRALSYIASRADEATWGGSQEPYLELRRLSVPMLDAHQHGFLDAGLTSIAERVMPTACIARFSSRTVFTAAGFSVKRVVNQEQCHY